MTQSNDLPTALPVAIATALLVLVLAPLLGDGSEQEACPPSAATSVQAAAADDACE